ncbi:hypothetical protein [Mucilaginibacter sp. SP1R1]|uniref:hypothetical protein n=1 Tax=Mucilaginibacter sp. SP1R1 TaxID=2723091 RepID=UPI0016078C4C|nr:hypothetical protein [Mucilaginibacter sp. SP1R1]MBB6151643.1 hypothetical protein [Mucilaginibacter sp. SP1R1]
MSKEEKTNLLKFLSPFATDVQEKSLWLRNFIWELYPQTNELVFDNYNDVVISWSSTEKVEHAFCAIAVDRTSNLVRLGFYGGIELADPEGLLTGSGRRYRYIQVENTGDLPADYIAGLLNKAWINALKKVNDYNQIVKGKTIVKSVSATKSRQEPRMG